jgi:hypothetical protein
MANEQFVYLGTPTNETSRKSSKVREDRRTVTIRQAGLLLTSIGDASTLKLVDQRGKGVLLSVKIVTDNPYVQLLLEIDDWRNDGETPAEMLYGGTGKQDYGVYALDGGNSAKGYTMLYTPQGGEAFDGRLRIQLRNRLPKTKIYGNNSKQTMPGGLPFPVNNGHAGGASFSAPLLSGATNLQLANAMAMPHYGDGYRSPQINLSLLGNMNAKAGIDHPFVGQAGKPIFASATTSFAATTVDENTILFGPQTTDANGVTSQILYVTNRAGDGLSFVTHDFALGQSLFIRDGGNIHFPGEISTVGTVTTDDTGNRAPPAIPTSVAGAFTVSATDTTQQVGLALTVKPGIANPPTMVNTPHTGGVMTNMGFVTSVAETDPKILIKSIEIKYRLEVSYDG